MFLKIYCCFQFEPVVEDTFGIEDNHQKLDEPNVSLEPAKLDRSQLKMTEQGYDLDSEELGVYDSSWKPSSFNAKSNRVNNSATAKPKMNPLETGVSSSFN